MPDFSGTLRALRLRTNGTQSNDAAGKNKKTQTGANL
jgi:hypothetical protein